MQGLRPALLHEPIPEQFAASVDSMYLHYETNLI